MDERIWAAVVDIETTGLSAQDCIPLELGIRLIDKEGFGIAEMDWLIWEPGHDWSVKMMEGAANKFVGPMHTASGLWDDLVTHRGDDTVTRQEIDAQLCEFLEANDVEFGKIPMMGNSTGSLDRPFTLVHFPHFNEALSYRNIDISTIKELCKVHNPILFENLKPIIGTKEQAQHRVMGDIDACITEYRAYIENFFFITD